MSKDKDESAEVKTAKINMMGTVLVALFALVSTLAGLYFNAQHNKQEASKPEKITYSGRILDASNGQPVVGAAVSVDVEGAPPAVYTDSDGVYQFDVALDSSKTGQIKVEVQGYQPYTRNIKLSPDNGTFQDIRLTPLTPTATPQTLLSFTSTPEPTITSAAPQATSTLQPKTLADGCIYAQTWGVDSTDASIVDGTTVGPDGCYSTDLLGIFAKADGSLEIINGKRKSNVASGVFIPIKNNSVIQFKVYITSMYIVYQDPTYISFAVAPANNPMDARNTARFKLAVEKNESKPVIFFVEANVGDAIGIHEASRHYVYKQTYTVKMTLDGNKMNVTVNGIPIDNSLVVPTGQKVFYIGYNLPILANIDALVTDLTIDGVKK